MIKRITPNARLDGLTETHNDNEDKQNKDKKICPHKYSVFYCCLCR